MFKRLTIFTEIMLIISLPILLLLTNVQVATFDLDFFDKKYDEYDIVKETGIEKDNLMTITKELLKYLKGDRDNIIIFSEVQGREEQVFEEREILHLKDVRILFENGFILRNLSLLLCIISLGYIILYNRKRISRTLIISSMIPFVLITILGILLKIDFYKYFTHFHEIFFSNDLWLLNPKTDILIQMYPLEFFYSIALRILVMFVVELVIMLAVGLLTLRRKTFIN